MTLELVKSKAGYALFGPTKDYKEAIKELGGSCHTHLLNPNTGKTALGWFFSHELENESMIEEFVSMANAKIKQEQEKEKQEKEKEKEKQEASQEEEEPQPKASKLVPVTVKRPVEDNPTIYEYSEKSYVVFGDSRLIKTELATLKGKYQTTFTHPETKEKTSGWMFAKSMVKLDALKKVVGNDTVVPLKKDKVKEEEESLVPSGKGKIVPVKQLAPSSESEGKHQNKSL